MKLNQIIEKIVAKAGYVKIRNNESQLMKPVISSYFRGGVTSSGLAPDFEYYQLVDAYKSWVYTSIDKIAKSVAMIPIRLYIFRKNEQKITSHLIHKAYKSITDPKEKQYFLKENQIKKVEIIDHPFLDLIHRPNQFMTRFMLWYETMIRLELGGMCGWYLVKNKLNIPVEVWPLPLTKFATLKPKITPDLKLEYWDYRDGNIHQRFDKEEIILIKYPHPASPFQGMSPLMAQTYPYDIDLFLMQQQRALFEHGAMPGLHLTTDQILSKEVVKELKEQINDQYKGALKSGETLITHSGLKAEKLGMTGREAMIREVERFARDKLITAYDLSPGKIGLVEDVNRANAEALNYSFIQECLRPKCMMIEEVIETFLLPLYDEGLFCDFELPDHEEKDFKLKERETNLRMFYTSINEERSKEGLPPVEWGDRPWGSVGQVQLGEGGSRLPSVNDHSVNDHAEETEKEIKHQKENRLNREFWTGERKEIEWKLFVLRSEKFEALALKTIRSYFSKLESEVIGRLNQHGKRYLGQYNGWSKRKIAEHFKAKPPKDINIDKEKEIERLTTLFTPVVQLIMKEVGNARMRDLAESLKISFEFNVNDPRTVRWIGRRMRLFSREVTNTTFDTIEAILREGFLEGQSIIQMTEILRERFESWDKYRAPLIARTETISAMNEADLEAVYQMGVEKKVLKHWLTAMDETVRETHQKAGIDYEDGIPFDEEFVVGEDKMQAPGGGQIAGENINCRCTLYYTEIEEETRSFKPSLKEEILENKTNEIINRLEELSKYITEEKPTDDIHLLIEKLEDLKKEINSINDKNSSLKSVVDVLKEKIDSIEKISQEKEPPSPIEVKINPLLIEQFTAPIENAVENAVSNLNMEFRKDKKKKLIIKRDQDGRMISADIE